MTIVTSWDGFKWDIREQFRHDQMVLTKREYSVLKLLTKVASKDKIFTEIGVHVGYYAIRMSKLYKLVHAFEPNPYSIEALKRNMELNNINNIKIFPFALGEKEGKKVLHLREGSSSLLDIKTVKSIAIDVKRLDDVIDWTDVMKIDVEGFEEYVIKGGLNIIYKCKPIIVIEHHDLGGYYEIQGAYQKIRGLLKDFVAFNLDGVRYAYVHRDKIKTINKDALNMLVVYHWFNKIVDNLQNKRAWYHGLHSTWWYGMGILDFLEVLPEYVEKEPIWLETIMKE